MKSLTWSILLFAAFASGQDIAGSWQGTLGLLRTKSG
jgi:hypothetical protein